MGDAVQPPAAQAGDDNQWRDQVPPINYSHPEFSAAAVATQGALPALNGRRHTYFAGSYFRHGFHEDAVYSATLVGACFGESL